MYLVPFCKLFQSTLPLRGVTRHDRQAGLQQRISIRTPLAGSDSNVVLNALIAFVFQSALPLRGVTAPGEDAAFGDGISIRTPLAGSDSMAEKLDVTPQISIRTPLAGSDRPPGGW